MITLLGSSIAVLSDTQQHQVAPKNLGEFGLVEEIADLKCYLGNMDLGNGKVHRECAVRCLGGRTPFSRGMPSWFNEKLFGRGV